MKMGHGAACMLLGIVLLTACGNEPAKDEAAPAAPAESQEQAGRVVEVTMSFIEPHVRPERIEIQAGEAVQFKVSSTDTRHSFVIEELGISVEVPQKSLNETATTKVVTPTKAGTFRMLCGIHARMPMKSTLVVSEAGKQ